MADMSRQLDVLSPGADGAVEPVSRAIAMREEIELQREAMKLQKEEALARQELMKTELQQREMERITGVQENEKQRAFAAEEGARARGHDTEMQEARKRIEQELMRDTEQFNREREERQVRRDDERQRRGIEAYKAIRQEEIEASRRNNEIVARRMDAEVMTRMLNDQLELNLAEIQETVDLAVNAQTKATSVLQEQLVAGQAAVEAYAERFESGGATRTSTRSSSVGGPGGVPQVVTSYDAAEPGVAVISGITDVLSLEQRQAVEGVYRVLVSLPSTGRVGETQRAAVEAAVSRASRLGVSTAQLDTILDGVASAVQAQASGETNPQLRAIYQQNLDGVSRASAFGIVPTTDQWQSMANMPARLVAAMRNMDVSEDEIARMAGPLYNDRKFMERVRQMQEQAQDYRTSLQSQRGLTREELEAASSSQMGPPAEALELLLP